MTKKELKRLANQLTQDEQAELMHALFENSGAPYIFMVSFEDGSYGGSSSKQVTSADYLNMMAGHIVQTAQKSEISPMTLLKHIEFTVNEMIKLEKHGRIEAADKGSPQAAEPAKRS
ncbi:MAG: hypothetical protein IKI76_02940 [Selenomonadaceae bacterium]|nr:hypothetical protein [Selenomonadaceae bacterium]